MDEDIARYGNNGRSSSVNSLPELVFIQKVHKYH